jgi:hypothetical protein
VHHTSTGSLEPSDQIFGHTSKSDKMGHLYNVAQSLFQTILRPHIDQHLEMGLFKVILKIFSSCFTQDNTLDHTPRYPSTYPSSYPSSSPFTETYPSSIPVTETYPSPYPSEPVYSSSSPVYETSSPPPPTPTPPPPPVSSGLDDSAFNEYQLPFQPWYSLPGRFHSDQMGSLRGMRKGYVKHVMFANSENTLAEVYGMYEDDDYSWTRL